MGSGTACEAAAAVQVHSGRPERTPDAGHLGRGRRLVASLAATLLIIGGVPAYADDTVEEPAPAPPADEPAAGSEQPDDAAAGSTADGGTTQPPAQEGEQGPTEATTGGADAPPDPTSTEPVGEQPDPDATEPAGEQPDPDATEPAGEQPDTSGTEPTDTAPNDDPDLGEADADGTDADPAGAQTEDSGPGDPAGTGEAPAAAPEDLVFTQAPPAPQDDQDPAPTPGDPQQTTGTIEAPDTDPPTSRSTSTTTDVGAGQVGVTTTDDEADEADEATATPEDAADQTTSTSADVPETQPSATGTATLVRTGNALAVGNLGENEVVQVIEVLVIDGGTVRIEQVAIVVSVGSARAHSGSNVVAAGSADGSAVASVITGDAVAIGNATSTDIDQRLALRGGPGQTITAEQRALVEHSGYAFASSGGNQVIAGGSGTGAAGASVTTTGNAYAIGNLSETIILQDGTATAEGDAWIASEQHASVLNRGVAIADTGGNQGDGGAGGAQLDTGGAIAEGSVSTNRVGQRAAAVARGGATVEMRQGALMLNLGVAIARSGGNALDHTGTDLTTSETGPGADLTGFDGFEEALLSIVLADELDLAGIGSVLQGLLSAALDEPIELWSQWSDETTTSWTDAEHDTMVEMIQRALVFDLGRAWVDSGDNAVLEVEHDGATSDSLRDRALAEVQSGDAFAVGNLAIADVCQRMGINTDAPGPPCVPEPEAQQPAPQAAPVLQEVEAEEPAAEEPAERTPEVLETAITAPPQPRPEPEPTVAIEPVSVSSPSAALPRTGVNVVDLVLVGLLLALLGTWALRGTVRPSSRRSDRRPTGPTW